VRTRAQQLADGFDALGLPRYGPRDPAHRAGIVTIRVDNPEALFDHLRAQGITAALRNRLVRFAPTYYNTSEDMDAVLAAVDAFVEGEKRITARA
jgi:selenocysteine lyase/cysteine desulfurase